MTKQLRLILPALAMVLAMVVAAPRPSRAQEFSKEIDILGFKFSVEDGSVEVENDKLVLKGKGSLDLSPALGSGAVITVDEMSLDHETTLKLHGITSPSVKLGPLNARIAPDDIVLTKIMEQGVSPSFNLNVILQIDIAGNPMEIQTIIPITKSGLKDAVVELKPPSGSDAFFKKDLNGATLALKTGKVEIKNRQFKTFTFDGSINIYGIDFEIDEVNVTSEGISGKITPGPGSSLQMGKIGLDLQGGVSFEYSASEFKLTCGMAVIDLATLIPGADGKIVISPLVITNGALSAEADITQALNVYGVSLSLKHFKLNGEKKSDGKTFVKIVLDGAVTIQDPPLALNFTGFEIDSDGNVKGQVALPQAQSFSMFGVGVSISAVNLSVASSTFSVDTSGEFLLGDDKLPFSGLTIAQGKVDAQFDVTKENPFMFSWFKYLKINAMAIDQNVLTMSGQIDIPAPFTYSFGFENISFDPAGLPTTAKAAAAAATGTANRAWNAVTSPDLVTLENTLNVPLEVAGFSFYIDAITIPNPLKVAKTKVVPETLLRLYMRAQLPLGDQTLYVNVDGLEVTKSGVKDLRLELGAPPGSDSLFKMEFQSWASLKIDRAVLVVKNNKIDSFSFKGAVTVGGKGFEVADFSISKTAVNGLLRPLDGSEFALGPVKLILQGDVSFSITDVAADSASGTSTGSTSARGPPGKSFNLTIKDLSIDFSQLFGTSSARITANELSINDGNIHADLSVGGAIDLFGLQLSLTKITLDSLMPTSPTGKREFKATLSGSFSIPNPYIELTFTNFVISSTGEFGGDLSLSALQEVNLFGATLSITKVRISKMPTEPIAVTVVGSIAFGSTIRINVEEFTYKGGLITAKFGVSEQNPFTLPYCDFVKVTQLEIKDNALLLSGYLQAPAPFEQLRLDLTGLKISKTGGLEGGVFSLHNAVSLNLGLFAVSISSASFDLQTRYLKFSGEIKLPADVFDKGFAFNNMGISLASVGGGALNTSATQFPATSANDKKHSFTLDISGVNFGQNSGKFYINLTGTLGLSVGGYGFTLNFENFKVTQDIQFSIGKVTGGIEIAGFKLYVSRFELQDTGPDPYVIISGGLALPGLGSLDVQGLEIHYKTGKIALEGLAIRVDYKAYVIEIAISYKDSIFKGEGNILIAGKGIHVAAMFSPTRWSADVDVYGLSIPLFYGITLDSIGGGFTYDSAENWAELRLRCGIAFVDPNLIYGTVELKFNTQGIISLTGTLTALKMIPMAEASLTIDVPHATVSGSLSVNQLVGGVVLCRGKLSFYFSPSNWYVSATLTADVFGVFNVANASLMLNSNGLDIKFWAGVNISIIKGEITFSLTITRSFDITASFRAYAEIDIEIASVSGEVKAYFSSAKGYFSGSLHLEACVVGICGSVGLDFWVDRSGAHVDW